MTQQISSIPSGSLSSSSTVAPLGLGPSSSFMLNSLSANPKAAWSANPFGPQPSALNFNITSKAINPNIKGFDQCRNAFRSIFQNLSRLIQVKLKYASQSLPLQIIVPHGNFFAVKVRTFLVLNSL